MLFSVMLRAQVKNGSGVTHFHKLFSKQFALKIKHIFYAPLGSQEVMLRYCWDNVPPACSFGPGFLSYTATGLTVTDWNHRANCASRFHLLTVFMLNLANHILTTAVYVLHKYDAVHPNEHPVNVLSKLLDDSCRLSPSVYSTSPIFRLFYFH